MNGIQLEVAAKMLYNYLELNHESICDDYERGYLGQHVINGLPVLRYMDNYKDGAIYLNTFDIVPEEVMEGIRYE